MALNGPTHVQLFQILLFLSGQLFTPRLERFVHPLNTREPNDRARNPLVDPRKCNMAHFPAVLLRKLLNALDDLVVGFCMSRETCSSFLLAFRTDGCAKGAGGAREMAATEWSPLCRSC